MYVSHIAMSWLWYIMWNFLPGKTCKLFCLDCCFVCIYPNILSLTRCNIKSVVFCQLITAGREFANGPGDLGSIPGCVIPKTLKTVLDTSLLNTQQYKALIKGKVEQSKEGSSRCSSYWKGSLLVTLNYYNWFEFIFLLVTLPRLKNPVYTTI